jgi:hypothetical protein
LIRNGDARPTKLSVEGATKYYYQTKTGLVHALEDYTMPVRSPPFWRAETNEPTGIHW